MSSISHQTVKTNGVTLHLVVSGSGPLVIFCHGFPGHWSRTHQLAATAEAGYTAIAVELRGYGESSRPSCVDDYNMDKQITDMLCVLDYFYTDLRNIVLIPAAGHFVQIEQAQSTSAAIVEFIEGP